MAPDGGDAPRRVGAAQQQTSPAAGARTYAAASSSQSARNVPVPASPPSTSENLPAPPLPPKIPSRQSTAKLPPVPVEDLLAPVSSSSFFGATSAPPPNASSSSARLSTSPTESLIAPPARSPAWTSGSRPAGVYDDASKASGAFANASSAAMTRVRSGSAGASLARSAAVNARTPSTMQGHETTPFRKPTLPRPAPPPFASPSDIRRFPSSAASGDYGDDFDGVASTDQDVQGQTSMTGGMGWTDPSASTSVRATSSWDNDDETPRASSPFEQRREFAPPRFAPPRRARLTRQSYGFNNIAGLGWTTPKLLEKPGLKGALGGIWDHSAWDFRILDTPPEYPAMGTWIAKPRDAPTAPSAAAEAASTMISETAPADASNDMQVDTEPNAATNDPTTAIVDGPAASENVSDPGAISTITREELDQVRPHPHLCYVPATHSWALFAPFGITPHPVIDDSEVPLWIQSHETADDILENLQPRLSAPCGVSDEDKMPPKAREVYQFALSHVLDAGPDDVTKIDESRSGQSIVFSHQDFFLCVIPRHLFQELLNRRQANPNVGDTAIESKLNACQILWRSIDNVLFKGEQRPLPYTGKVFSRHLPWDEVTECIFVGILGFIASPEATLSPPELDVRIPLGRANRQRLLRCWLELGLWIEATRKINDSPRVKRHSTRLELISANEAMYKLLGPDTLARLHPSSAWTSGRSEQAELPRRLAEAYGFLGVTPDLADDVLQAVYHQQVNRCANYAPNFLEAITDINADRRSDALEMLIIMERSVGRCSLTDLINAYRELGLEYDRSRSTSDDEMAVRFTTRRDEVTHPDRRKVLRDAMKLIAEHRDSELLKVMLMSATDEEDRPAMTLEKAYKLLEVTNETPEDMLIMIYDVRINDAPGQKDVMTQALATIGEAIGSDAIRQKLAGEQGIIIPKPATDLPVGLTNIANTCYLNSLLQYFFTVRELREAILRFQPTPTSDDDAALNRVGGRRVTKAEVERSKKFVLLLQSLFNQLIHTPSTSITPETELAYLALVPSKDEAEMQKANDAAAAVADDDDVIIVDKPSPAAPVGSPAASGETVKSPSVLGKRRNSHLDSDVDAALGLGQIRIDSSQTQSPIQSPSDEASPPADVAVDMQAAVALARTKSSEEPKLKRGKSVDDVIPNQTVSKSDDDIEIDELDNEIIIVDPPIQPQARRNSIKTMPPAGSAPALPPRRPRRKSTKLEDQVSNYMSFGRQNDVTECMDNVMFQIECALNPSVNEGPDSCTEMASVLRRTLYGKMRQHLEFLDPSVPDPVRTKEEPFFSLLVDVAEEGRNVYDGLDTVFDDSLVTIEGQQARRRVRLVDVPPILQIQLQRVQYDRAAQRIFKSNAHMDFGETLSLDRYLEVESGDEEAIERQRWTQEKRDEIELCRARLTELKSTKTGASYGSILKDALSHVLAVEAELSELFIHEQRGEFIGDSRDEAAAIEGEILELENRIVELRQAIETTWQEQQNAVYELVSVFIHRGTALSGHYFIYQRDSKNLQRWLKYNDAFISEVPGDDKVFLKSKDDTNAYFLVYCRRDCLSSIESIAREL